MPELERPRTNLMIVSVRRHREIDRLAFLCDRATDNFVIGSSTDSLLIGVAVH